MIGTADRQDGATPTGSPWHRGRAWLGAAIARHLPDGRRPRGTEFAVESGIIIAWALLVAWPLLDLNPAMVPSGREFLSAIQSHHIWAVAQQCGPCVMWNGAVRGGAPAFVDPYGSMLHPLVVVTSLGWGSINGAKLALAGAFIMAGMAQLWLGTLFGLGRIARLWGACLAIVAGHLSGRAEIGTFGLVLSTAACSLVLPALVAAARTGRQRDGAVLGLVLGQALLAGQGYMQVAMVLCLPLGLLLIPWHTPPAGARLRGLLLGGVIGLALAAPFLVPLAHFAPAFTKDGDASFAAGQPVQWIPLNLLIDDAEFFWSGALQKLPYPYLYINYVGWIPALLALWGGLVLWRRQQQLALFLGLSVLMPLWLSSGTPLRWIALLLPGTIADAITGLRHVPVMAGLAVPPLIVLAALAVDALLERLHQPLRISASFGQRGTAFGLDGRWLLLPVLLVALHSPWRFGQQWLQLTPLVPDTTAILDALATPELQWVNAPFGEHFFVTPAADRGLKLALGVRPWGWHERPLPDAWLNSYRDAPPEGLTPVGVVGGVQILRGPPERQYAQVIGDDGSRTVCRGSGRGGDLDIACPAHPAGRLVVREYMWPGWGADVDGRPASLVGTVWLEIAVPRDTQQIRLRYRPWDVPLGVALALTALGFSGMRIWRDRTKATSVNRGGDPPA